MRTPSAVLFALLLSSVVLGGCVADTTSPADDGDAAETTEELSARAPIPYLLQFVGTYENAAAKAGQVKTLVLTRSGRYSAAIVGQSKLERGAFVGVSHITNKPSDGTLHLITKGLGWTVAIEGYTSKVKATRSGLVTELTAKSIVGPNESLCDDSGGSWTDDDVDAATGLYCLCGAGKSYIPSAGGCVR